MMILSCRSLAGSGLEKVITSRSRRRRRRRQYQFPVE